MHEQTTPHMRITTGLRPELTGEETLHYIKSHQGHAQERWTQVTNSVLVSISDSGSSLCYLEGYFRSFNGVI